MVIDYKARLQSFIKQSIVTTFLDVILNHWNVNCELFDIIFETT